MWGTGILELFHTPIVVELCVLKFTEQHKPLKSQLYSRII